MITNIAHINFPSHSVHVSQCADGDILMFKYDDAVCDFIKVHDQYDAADWLLAPLPYYTYKVVWDDES